MIQRLVNKDFIALGVAKKVVYKPRKMMYNIPRLNAEIYNGTK
tara:strand:+ start:1107 stop:1235 length:129 start_codon:yes stop_codon:yes gene_type:complete